jgi:hypothetical protein
MPDRQDHVCRLRPAAFSAAVSNSARQSVLVRVKALRTSSSAHRPAAATAAAGRTDALAFSPAALSAQASTPKESGESPQSWLGCLLEDVDALGQHLQQASLRDRERFSPDAGEVDE